MAACTLIDYEFNELPLISDGKHFGGFQSGTATIASYDDDEWFVRAINLDGVELEKDVYPQFWAMIANALERPDPDQILEAIRIEDAGIAARMGWKRSAA